MAMVSTLTSIHQYLVHGLFGEDGEIRDKREDIYFDMLVSEVDELVEKTDDYEKRIAETYISGSLKNWEM